MLCQLQLERQFTVAVLAEVVRVDGLRIIGDGDVGVKKDWSVELLHHLFVLLESYVLFLLGLSCLCRIFQGLKLLLAELRLLFLCEGIEPHGLYRLQV